MARALESPPCPLGVPALGSHPDPQCNRSSARAARPQTVSGCWPHRCGHAGLGACRTRAGGSGWVGSGAEMADWDCHHGWGGGAGAPSTAPGCCTRAEGVPGSAHLSPLRDPGGIRSLLWPRHRVPVPDPAQDWPEPCVSCSWGPLSCPVCTSCATGRSRPAGRRGVTAGAAPAVGTGAGSGPRRGSLSQGYSESGRWVSSAPGLASWGQACSSHWQTA